MLMDEATQKVLEESVANGYYGHYLMERERFHRKTKHLIVYKVLAEKCEGGLKDETWRLYQSEDSYQRALADEKRRNIEIVIHSAVSGGCVAYPDKVRV